MHKYVTVKTQEINTLTKVNASQIVKADTVLLLSAGPSH